MKMTKRRRRKAENRLRITQEQRGKCYYCNSDVWVKFKEVHGTSSLEATLDHIIPRSKNGKGLKDNYVIACKECNRIRGNYSADEFKRIRLMPNWKEVWKDYMQKNGG